MSLQEIIAEIEDRETEGYNTEEMELYFYTIDEEGQEIEVQ